SACVSCALLCRLRAEDRHSSRRLPKPAGDPSMHEKRREPKKESPWTADRSISIRPAALAHAWQWARRASSAARGARRRSGGGTFGTTFAWSLDAGGRCKTFRLKPLSLGLAALWFFLRLLCRFRLGPLRHLGTLPAARRLRCITLWPAFQPRPATQALRSA